MVTSCASSAIRDHHRGQNGRRQRHQSDGGLNQGLDFAEALQRCHAIDDLGLAWIEEPIVYDNLDGYARLAADLKTPIQIGENFYGPRDRRQHVVVEAGRRLRGHRAQTHRS